MFSLATYPNIYLPNQNTVNRFKNRDPVTYQLHNLILTLFFSI